MRLLLGFSATWFLIALSVGFVGESLLHKLWRANEDRKIVAVSGLMASIWEDAQWQETKEDDDRQKELQNRWQVRIAPIPADSAEAKRFANRDDGSFEANDWEPGKRRIGRLVAFSKNPNVGVKVTSNVDFTRVHRLWWGLWLTTLTLGCFMVVFTAYFFQQYAKLKRSSLKPWVDATRQITDSAAARIPEGHSTDEDLAVQLSIIRESVNKWLSELQSKIQRSELVLSNMQEGVLAVDEKSRVLLANAAVVRLLGISSEAYLYRSLVEVIRTPRIVNIIERVLESSVPQEESFEHGNQQLSLRVFARPVQLGGNHVGALMTVRDETLLKRIESVRRDFVTNASHELKTPLAAIRAYAETLQMGAIDDVDATHTFLTGILSQADRINNLINGMLQLARVQAGDAILKRVRFNVQSEIGRCIEAAEVMAGTKQVVLTTELPAAPVFMHSDPEAVQTVISNLLSNAVRYTPAGGTVSLHLAASGTGLTIRVLDTGVGIAKEELARIFERFYRVERARTTETGGTGLGLSIVKHILQALDGSVSVTSELGAGSCFEVYLPLQTSQ